MTKPRDEKLDDIKRVILDAALTEFQCQDLANWLWTDVMPPEKRGRRKADEKLRELKA